MLLLYGLVTFQQAKLDGSKRARELLEATKHRIRAMGRVHHMLYQSKNLSEIDFSEYIRDIVYEIVKAYKAEDKKIVVTFDMEPYKFNIDKAIPCGLMVNELVVNAFKHAFPRKKGGSIAISLKRKKETEELSVRDDGVGMPREYIYGDIKTLGLKLVMMLANQIDGKLSYKRQNGSIFTVEIKDELIARDILGDDDDEEEGLK
jgi:two-component sensor histidine kinase